jgi:hypothetical protein
MLTVFQSLSASREETFSLKMASSIREAFNSLFFEQPHYFKHMNAEKRAQIETVIVQVLLLLYDWTALRDIFLYIVWFLEEKQVDLPSSRLREELQIWIAYSKREVKPLTYEISYCDVLFYINS